MRIIPVGIGEIRFSSQAGDVLVCYGLGSCVGVALYDPVSRVGGLVHVMLPAQPAPIKPATTRLTTMTRAATIPDGQAAQPGRFADIAVPYALKELVHLGAVLTRLQVKLAGGAQMLGLMGDGSFDIGTRNSQAVRAALAAQQLRVHAEVIGGSVGRTMQLHLADGRVQVSSFGSGEITI
jgi:chemotaxis protein CheD